MLLANQLGWDAYPALFSRHIEPPVFYHNYIETYLNRDVADISNIRDMHAFRRFLSLCAGRTGQLLNLVNLARDCNITQPTAKAWLSILESSYIVFLLQPYHKNYNKRIIKTPKLYFYDTGLACFLLGICKPEDMEMFDLAGNIFENMVIADFIKRNQHQYLFREYWFWRDSNGNEIDLLTKNGLLLDIFKIKSTQTLNSRLFNGLDYFTSVSGEEINACTHKYSQPPLRNNTFLHGLALFMEERLVEEFKALMPGPKQISNEIHSVLQNVAVGISKPGTHPFKIDRADLCG